MALRTELGVEKPQLSQLPSSNLRCVLLHLVDVPIDTQEPAFEEVSFGRIEPKGHSAGKSLRIFCEGRECIDDYASIGGFYNTRMDGEGADVGIFWAELVRVLKGKIRQSVMN